MAEEAGVRIGIHPDDPPQPMLAGVPRCIFSNFEGYKRAIEIANSTPYGLAAYFYTENIRRAWQYLVRKENRWDGILRD